MKGEPCSRLAVNQPKGTKNESNSQRSGSQNLDRMAVNQPKGTKNESNSQLIFTELHKLFNRQRTPGYSRKLNYICSIVF